MAFAYNFPFCLKFLSDNWYFQQVWNNFAVEILLKLFGCRAEGQRVVLYANEYLLYIYIFFYDNVAKMSETTKRNTDAKQ